MRHHGPDLVERDVLLRNEHMADRHHDFVAELEVRLVDQQVKRVAYRASIEFSTGRTPASAAPDSTAAITAGKPEHAISSAPSRANRIVASSLYVPRGPRNA